MGFLKGKTAIITGGGYAVLSDGRCGSIGYGIATAYAKEGANLVITGRNVQKLEKAKEELEKLYGSIFASCETGLVSLNLVKNGIENCNSLSLGSDTHTAARISLKAVESTCRLET
jgi:NAD(P)-dependent dehydrogenase (short-subunit alcohol dehydrogenase family)